MSARPQCGEQLHEVRAVGIPAVLHLRIAPPRARADLCWHDVSHHRSRSIPGETRLHEEAFKSFAPPAADFDRSLATRGRLTEQDHALHGALLCSHFCAGLCTPAAPVSFSQLLRGLIGQSEIAVESSQFVEQRFCFFQITQVEAFCEPLIGRREQLTRLGAPALL